MSTCSLDYLMSALKLLSTTRYMTRVAVKLRIAAFNQGSPLLENGLVEVKRLNTSPPTLAYRLVRPYNTLTVKDLITPSWPKSTVSRRLYTLCEKKRLSEIDSTTIANVFSKKTWTLPRMVGVLGVLSTHRYYSVNNIIPQNDYEILDAMRRENIVICHDKPGKGYRLVQSLSRLRISAFLPYIYSADRHAQCHNRLLYIARFHPVSALISIPPK